MKTDLEKSLELEITSTLNARLAQLTSRKEKSKEAAAYLFFQHGIYPSAKTVHSYTQQGSLTDINRDLQEFWDNLRNQTRVKLDAPSIPPNILAMFSESLEKLWDSNVAQAKSVWSDERLEMEKKLEAAHLFAEEIETLNHKLENEKKELNAALSDEILRREEAEKLVEAQAAEIKALKESITDYKVNIENIEIARAQAEQRFSSDLQAERQARQRDADQFHSEINFAKMQIESARQAERDARERFTSELQAKDAELAIYKQRANNANEALTTIKLEYAQLSGKYAVAQGRCDELEQRSKSGYGNSAKLRRIGLNNSQIRNKRTRL